jgi:hypothetical protein
VQRLAGGRWHSADSDLGLRILWRVADDKPKFSGVPRFKPGEAGSYTAWWEPALSAPTGRYRFLVTARRYRLASRSFRLRPADNLAVVVDRGPRRATIRVAYPLAAGERDFTARPGWAASGRVTVTVDGRRVSARIRAGAASVAARASARLSVARGGARDAFGNANGTRWPQNARREAGQ